MSYRQELRVAQLLPREARPCDWVADPGRLASVLGWGTSGETILGAEGRILVIGQAGRQLERADPNRLWYSSIGGWMQDDVDDLVGRRTNKRMSFGGSG